jgi:hypothetical protein
LQHLAVDSIDCLHDPCRSCGKARGIWGTYTRAPYATWFTVCGRTWLQDWHLPRHQGWTYLAHVRYDKKLECLSLWWHAPLRRDHPGYCTAEVGNPGGTYELPHISAVLWQWQL